MRLIPLIAIALCFLQPPALAVERHLLVMPLGDSITAGGYNDQQGWHIGGGYRTTLAEFLWAQTIEFHLVGSLSNGPDSFPEPRHEGHSGWEIDQLTAGVPAWIPPMQPDIILLMIGSNDIIKARDIAHAPNRLDTLITKIRTVSANSDLLLSTLILTNNRKWNREIAKYNRDIYKIVQRRSATDKHLNFVDMAGQAGLSTTPADLIDGVHPTPLGYAKIGKVWGTAVIKILGTPPAK